MSNKYLVDHKAPFTHFQVLITLVLLKGTNSSSNNAPFYLCNKAIFTLVTSILLLKLSLLCQQGPLYTGDRAFITP